MRYESLEIWQAVKQVKYKRTLDELREVLKNSRGDVNEAIATVLNLVCHAAHAQAGTFWFYSRFGDGLIHPRAQFGGGDISLQYLKPGEGIAGQVIRSGAPTVVSNAQAEAHWTSKFDEASGFNTESMVCVPLKTAEDTFGCIQLLNKTDDTAFDTEDLELVSVMCEEIAIQFANLNLLSDGRTENEVAVLFADIRGFTDIAAKLDCEQVADLLNRYLGYASRCIKENAGIADKYIGDCAMAYWINSEKVDAAYQACCAAFEMMQNREYIQAACKEKFGVDVTFGVGIAYGPAYVGNIGTAVLSDHTVVGNTVNVAAYLEEEAPADTILVTEEVAKAVGNRCKFEKAEGVIAKDGGAIYKLATIGA